MQHLKSVCLGCRSHLETLAESLPLKAQEIDILETPRKIIQFKIPLTKDNGQKQVYDGLRVQYNNALGPTKGGIRFQENVTLDEMKLFGFLMALKCSLAHLPYGGAKGGVAVKAEELSQSELERLSRSYIKEIYQDIGPQIDIPAPDMNTNEKMMDWMVDEYAKLTGQKTLAVITGKSLANGGSEGRSKATALGGAFVLKRYLNFKKINLKDKSVVIQGFGNVGGNLAKILSDWGMKIIAVSDFHGGLYNKNGLDIKKILANQPSRGVLPDYKEAKKISNNELLCLECDILAPSALEHQIKQDNADKIKAKIILEMANAPITPEADRILNQNNLAVIPDILANAGGVIVSYFEWLQNLNNEKWSEEKVFKMLEEKINMAFDSVLKTCQINQCDLRTPSHVVAVNRILEAERKRGNL